MADLPETMHTLEWPRYVTFAAEVDRFNGRLED
jgi:hypothetical protein